MGKKNGYGKIFIPSIGFFYEGIIEDGRPQTYGRVLCLNKLRDLQNQMQVEGLGQMISVYEQRFKYIPFEKFRHVFYDLKKGSVFCFSKSNGKDILDPDYSPIGFLDNYSYTDNSWVLKLLNRSKSNYFYEGEFENGEIQGTGMKVEIGKSVYIGEFKQGVKHGLGDEIDSKNGNIFTGDYEYERRHGKGNYIYLSKLMRYYGEVTYGKIAGMGTLEFKDGRKYQGQFKNNKFNGEGRFIWPNGEFYEGGYKENKRHGEGTYYYSNGITGKFLYNYGIRIEQEVYGYPGGRVKTKKIKSLNF